MRVRFLLPIVSAAFCGYGIQQEGQEAALRAKVDALEARIVTVETYLQAQAASAESLGVAIDDAVAKGYTAGINFEARQVLVDAWRHGIATTTSNVPGRKPQPAGPPVDPRIVRREVKRDDG